uniref:histone acetyltransferase n=1 Tax=Steinernema glaseri TaxID=37863 RepID=A0A1I7Y9T8_9BILA
MGSQSTPAPTSQRVEYVKASIAMLEHTSRCRDPACPSDSCYKLSRVMVHNRGCRRRRIESCFVCQQLVTLCRFHAKECHKERCRVPYCQRIRRKLQERAMALLDEPSLLE